MDIPNKPPELHPMASVLNPPQPEQKNVVVRHPERDATKVNDSKAEGGIRKDKAHADKALKADALKKDAQEARDEVEARQKLKLVSQFKAGERKVIAHEQAHTSVGGGLVNGASYSYTRGPDGKSYISGGDVTIDTSGAKTPEETIEKMARVRAAALAPADPSPQDRAVASRATVTEAAARLEVVREEAKAEEAAKEDPSVPELVPDEKSALRPVEETAKSEAKVSEKAEVKVVEKVDFKDKEVDALKKISIYA